MKKPFKTTLIGRLLLNVLSVTAATNPIVGVVKKVLLGGVIDASPLSSLKLFFDVNGDGKFDIRDIREMKWQDFMRLVVVALIWAVLYRFKVLSLLGF